MVKIPQGVVHGRTIELDGETGIEDGRVVEVVLRSKKPPRPAPEWRSARTETAAGMLSHLPDEVDKELEEIIRSRQGGSFREVP